MNKYQKSLIDFMKTGEIEIELKHLSQRQLIRLVEEQQQRIDKAIEYLTSYESIEEIQHTERIEDNKDLDNNTMIEMTNRYLEVHDKILSILRGEE